MPGGLRMNLTCFSQENMASLLLQCASLSLSSNWKVRGMGVGEVLEGNGRFTMNIVRKKVAWYFFFFSG